MFGYVSKKPTTGTAGLNLLDTYGMPNEDNLSKILTKYYGEANEESYFRHHMNTSNTFKELANNIMRWTGRSTTDESTMNKIARELESYIAVDSRSSGGVKNQENISNDPSVESSQNRQIEEFI